MRIQPIKSLVLIVLLFLAVGVRAQDGVTGSLTIYAATSLTDVFEEIKDSFEAAYPEVEILLNFSSSSTLAAQIIAGAPADIFASANELQMEHVVETADRIADDDIQVFAHNQLVLILPADNPAGIESLLDLTGDGILLVLAAQGTPIRAYTDAMIESYAEEYGEDFSELMLENLVSEESNVRQVVARVALGEADAGIVYRTDAIGDVSDQLITIPIADRHNQQASYLIAPLSDTANAAAADTFVAFLLVEDAQLILADYGFCTPAILDDVEPIEGAPEPTSEPADEPAAEIANCKTPDDESG